MLTIEEVVSARRAPDTMPVAGAVLVGNSRVNLLHAGQEWVSHWWSTTHRHWSTHGLPGADPSREVVDMGEAGGSHLLQRRA